jgi:hypothetical protein
VRADLIVQDYKKRKEKLMIFNPQNLIKKEGSFVFSGVVKANAHSSLNKSILKEFWNNFAFQYSSIDVRENREFIFTIGSAEKLALDEYDYSINITPDGICVYAENGKDLLHGFMTLLDRFKAIDKDGDLSVCVPQRVLEKILSKKRKSSK